ncbi:Transglycosylase SLT domain-containing protein [Caloramator fervidus]|uniref:Transglycosylase SLT domain-containing protein n=1 Tax=Caloramator fervidus TaxID=29344 RepID=A0A1H5V960_9CLOT|nr:lytic transglycosylase domain-containing protein [Caloramator fervidus]SEF83879.1 Transglycosylase SLT domain-containing protein [Caloramator fervidus]
MKIEDLAKILQIYILQSTLANNLEGSVFFDDVLESILRELKGQTKEDNLNNNPNDEGLNIKSIEDAIKAASKKYGVEEALIKAVIKQESGFNQNAVSKAGAIGLMQLMPQTARALKVDPYNPFENIEGGVRYLKSLINNFKGNKYLALAAYNGGIGRMKKLGVDTIEEISKMPKETVNYVKKVMENYERYKFEERA